jgi:outer membrane receptor for ferrienterochelin and colicin
MREKRINLNLYGSGELNVDLRSVLTPIKEAVVSAQKSVTLQRFEVGAEKINITSFKLLPTSMGESDIIKSVLLIPGVQSVGEGSAGFNVRGGSTDQNLILLYGAPVYNSSHFFGFFSAVNSDIIKDVTLYKGGIPSRYGERISSVLDIGSREGNRKEFAGNAGISPITTHLSLEGPIIKDTLTYLLTARTTYSNWIFGLINDPAIHRSRASFYDLNGKVTYDINKNNKIDLSAYFSHDAFRFNYDTTYSYNNSIVALKWRHFFNSRFFSSFSLNNSFYGYDISSQYLKSEAFVLSHRINSTGLKADFNWFLGRNEINFGIDLTRYSIIPGRYLPYND